MPDYLVEAYDTTAGMRSPPEGLAAVRRISSIHVPADEISLHVFTAPSCDELRAALERGAYAYERIVEAVHQRGEEER